MAKKRIVITVHGGLIQDIEGIPKDIIVEVRDYDVEFEEGFHDGAEFKIDNQGDEFYWYEMEV